MVAKRNFGFEMHAGRQIDLDVAGNSLATELSEAVKAWNSCISCGSCTAVCPAGINFRKLHYAIRLLSGLPRPEHSTVPDIDTDVSSQAMTTLNSCFLCGRCQLVCPRGIPTRYLAIQIMQKTKNYAEGIPSV